MSYVVRQYRLTRPQCYNFGCIGYEDVSARQGYYETAESGIEAAEQLKKVYPGEKFDVQHWDGGENHGRLIGRF